MMHLMDYPRDGLTAMTKCGLVVGIDHITDHNPADLESKIAEGICSTCSQAEMRLDEPDLLGQPIPNVEGQPFRKEERYGD